MVTTSKGLTRMGEVHRLLDEKGHADLLADPRLPFDRAVVEAASSYLTCEAREIGYLYSGWAQSALPHKRLADDASWQVRTDYVSLLVEPGKRHTLTGDPIPIGVPYGSRARLIILYLQSEAMRTNSREIELGRSLHAWLRKLEISVGGSSMAAVRDQAERISRCRMSFQIKQGNRTGLINQNILDTAMFVDADGDSPQGSLFAETAKLSEMFFEQLKRHPVPIEESAIKSISNNSQAIDTYCFLAYRLHALSSPTMVPWKSLMAQFGAGVSAPFKFRQQFRGTLELAMAVYPEAKVEVLPRGVMLHPSPPPVSPKIFPLAPRHKARDFSA
jgi:Plasmid encoded RepA protein